MSWVSCNDLEVGYSRLTDTISAEIPEGCTAAGQDSVTRRLRNHPRGNRLPDTIARLALIGDEVRVIAVLNFVPIGFDMSCHLTLQCLRTGFSCPSSKEIDWTA